MDGMNEINQPLSDKWGCTLYIATADNKIVPLQKLQDSAWEAADVRGAGQEEVLERGGHLAHPGEHQRPLPVIDVIQHQISEPHQ